MGGVGGTNAAPPKSLMAVFERACPHYLAMGMTYEQYWDGEVSAHKAYRKAKELRISEQNRMAWLQGIYVYEAIADLAPYLKAFSKSKPKPYSSEPYDLFEHERQARREREERERYERIKEKVAAFAAKQKQLNSKKSEVDSDA
jgi:hypothetical protein